jgi:hypothetical protein
MINRSDSSGKISKVSWFTVATIGSFFDMAYGFNRGRFFKHDMEPV